MATEAGPDTLAHRVDGQRGPDGTKVVLVHGFSQTGECLGPLGDALEVGHRVVRVDQPGHGGSLRHLEADLVRGAEMLVTTAGRAVYLGYSMGARLCLHAALAEPASVEALVLIGGTAGIIEEDARLERRRSDEALAQRIEEVGIDRFLEDWLSLPMFAGLPDWARFDHERRRNTAGGLAASLRHAGTGTMEPLWDRLAELECPVLCVTGSLDERYGELANAMVSRLAGPAVHREVPGAGHAAHLENPEGVIELVSSFLAELRG
jgi:2-succinyl-6-hydroxy-2,4-cyclohexadiene-1-carboxylate synthase